MSIKAYAGVLTATITAIFVFDVLWAFTQITIENAIAMSMFSSLAAGIVFYLFAYREEKEMDDGWSRFEDMGNGLNVMIQMSSGKERR